MKKWKVVYIPKWDEEDVSEVWVEANTKEEAKIEANSEYWDIKDIIAISEIK